MEEKGEPSHMSSLDWRQDKSGGGRQTEIESGHGGRDNEGEQERVNEGMAERKIDGWLALAGRFFFFSPPCFSWRRRPPGASTFATEERNEQMADEGEDSDKNHGRTALQEEGDVWWQWRLESRGRGSYDFMSRFDAGDDLFMLIIRHLCFIWRWLQMSSIYRM